MLQGVEEVNESFAKRCSAGTVYERAIKCQTVPCAAKFWLTCETCYRRTNLLNWTNSAVHFVELPPKVRQ